MALAQGFDDVSALAAAGWTFLNDSTAPGALWDQGNSGIFTAAAGAPASYAAANYLGTTGLTGAVSNWLITPRLQLDSTSNVSLAVRAAGGGYLDRLEVLLSTTGTAAANFSLLGSYSASSDEGWVARSYGAGLSSPTLAYVAFRYVVADVAVNGNYLGIDSIRISAVPEASTSLLFALGLAGLAALSGVQIRRRPHA